MKLSFNRKQVVALQKKLEEDPELAALLPISEELIKLYKKRKQGFLKTLTCEHEWPTDSHGQTLGPMACMHCGLLYYARNKERTLETFEQDYTVLIEIHG